jgi:hypothetical protein
MTEQERAAAIKAEIKQLDKELAAAHESEAFWASQPVDSTVFVATGVQQVENYKTRRLREIREDMANIKGALAVLQDKSDAQGS